MRQVPFSRSLLIERSDFDEFANKKYFRFKGVGSKAPPHPPPTRARPPPTAPPGREALPGGRGGGRGGGGGEGGGGGRES